MKTYEVEQKKVVEGKDVWQRVSLGTEDNLPYYQAPLREAALVYGQYKDRFNTVRLVEVNGLERKVLDGGKTE